MITTKSAINYTNKQSVVSAFDSNNDTLDKQKIEPVTPIDVHEEEGIKTERQNL